MRNAMTIRAPCGAKNQSNAAGAWIKSHLINSSLCLPPAHLARWATKVTSQGDQEYLNKTTEIYHGCPLKNNSELLRHLKSNLVVP